MKRKVAFASFGLFVLCAFLLIRPISGSGNLGDEAAPFAPVLDREGRTLIGLKTAYRAFYTSDYIPSENILKLVEFHPKSWEDPVLVSEDLSEEEARRLARVPGVILETYYRPDVADERLFSWILKWFNRVSSSEPVELTISWEVQERARELVDGFKRRFRLSGAVVVEIPSGEVYALVSTDEDTFVPTETLFRADFLLAHPSAKSVFGEPTGIEIKEEVGLFWPERSVFATPVQIARAFAAVFCKEPPRLHLVRNSTSLFGECAKPSGKVKTEYNYFDGKNWIYVKIWPKDRPSFIIVFVGKGGGVPPKKLGLYSLLKELSRYDVLL